MSELPGSDLRRNRDAVESRLRAACIRAGRDPAEVTLIWVSKTHPRERIIEALALGARHFGENRVQEALEKFPLPASADSPADPAGYTLHLIGRLQKNKVRKILPLAGVIHSIDSLELLEAVDRIAGELGLRRDVYLQVNTSREPQKGGLEPGDLPAVRAALKATPPKHLRLVGLMTMGPMEGGPEEARPCFRELRGHLADFRAAGGFPEMVSLSMGMTGDFEVAIEEGSNVIRVGTGLFGHRPVPPPAEPGV
jgi:pyridoxal phosphate enzyme (YggS family)